MSGNNNNNNTNSNLPGDLGRNATASNDDEYAAHLLSTIREGPGALTTDTTSEAGPSTAAPAQHQGPPEQVLMWCRIQDHIATRTADTPPISVICVICQEELVIPDLQETNGDREDYMVLGCDHVIGWDCMWHWIEEKYHHPGGVPCPICRKPLSREDVFADDDDDYPQEADMEYDDGENERPTQVVYLRVPRRDVSPLARVPATPSRPLGETFRASNPLQGTGPVPSAASLALPPRSEPSSRSVPGPPLTIGFGRYRTQVQAQEPTQAPPPRPAARTFPDLAPEFADVDPNNGTMAEYRRLIEADRAAELARARAAHPPPPPQGLALAMAQSPGPWATTVTLTRPGMEIFQQRQGMQMFQQHVARRRQEQLAASAPTSTAAAREAQDRARAAQPPAPPQGQGRRLSSYIDPMERSLMAQTTWFRPSAEFEEAQDRAPAQRSTPNRPRGTTVTLSSQSREMLLQYAARRQHAQFLASASTTTAPGPTSASARAYAPARASTLGVIHARPGHPTVLTRSERIMRLHSRQRSRSPEASTSNANRRERSPPSPRIKIEDEDDMDVD